MPTCPAHPDTQLEAKKKGWYCEDCDRSVLTYAQLPLQVAVLSWPNDLDPATLPTWLAHPWASLCAESHPRVRLAWLTDTAELVVRWTVALALTEVVHANAGRLPEAVADAIAEHVERPTLGRWLGVLRALGGAAPAHPLLTRGLFEWAERTLAPCFTSEGAGGELQNSLLVLRNHAAHGGGMSRNQAAELVAAHLPTLVMLIGGVRDTLGDTALVANGVHLIGTQPGPSATTAPGPGAWLVGPAGTLPLDPLLYYGDVLHVATDGQVRARAGGPTAQAYTRGNRDRLTYTPLGTDASSSERFDVAAFRALFQLDRARLTGTPQADRVAGFAYDDFVREARLQSTDLIGRAAELERAKAWLKSRDPYGDAPRVGWISAGPGVGKSMLMARLVADYDNGDKQQARGGRGLYYHRFRVGDARNDRRSFLRLLQAALLAWQPIAAVTDPPAEDAGDGQKLEDDVAARLAVIATLAAPDPRAPRPCFWVFLDGLDEASGPDGMLPELIQKLSVPGTVWLAAGRPDRGLDRAFAATGCESVFDGGLPPMHAGDIRAMLLEGLGGGRYALLARDEDTDEGADSPAPLKNDFVDAVVRRAQGLPLYVHLLLEDLRAGHLDVRSEARLPDGLTAYYDALVERLGISDAKHDLTQIIALLARAEEPLDTAGLALLLARGCVEDVMYYLPRVEAAVRAGAALLRRSPAPDAADGWVLYHQSFREYVRRSRTLPGSGRDAERTLVNAAVGWSAQTAPELRAIRAHLFRWGTEYALWWGGAEGSTTAAGRLTDFAYLQARTAALPAAECKDLAQEYADVLTARGGTDPALALWEAFMREREHMLRRGDAEWPANRVLLQLAVEHADDSPVTKAAEAWLETGACDWVWLKQVAGQRPKTVRRTGLIAVLEGHEDWVNGALELADGQLLSWSEDSTLRLWHGATGGALATLKGHTERVTGALALPDGRLLSWSGDGSLRLWDGATGAALVTLWGHTASVNGALALPDDRLLSWSQDGTLRLWDGVTGAALVTLDGHTRPVTGALALPDGRLLSWSGDHTLRLWDGTTGELIAVLGELAEPPEPVEDAEENQYAYESCMGSSTGHTAPVNGAIPLPNGRLLSWSEDQTLRLWDGKGAPLAESNAAEFDIIGATSLLDGRIAFWSSDGMFELWDGECHKPLDPPYPSTCVTPLPDGRYLTWSYESRDVCLQDVDGDNTEYLAGHTEPLCGALPLKDGRLLSWAQDGTLRVWTADGAPLAVMMGHTLPISGATELINGRLLSWSKDGTLRLWQDNSANIDGSLENQHVASGVQPLPNGGFVAWDKNQLRLIAADGAPGLVLRGHRSEVCGAKVLLNGSLVSWSRDSLCVWSGAGKLLRSPKLRVVAAHWLDDGRVLLELDEHLLTLWDGGMKLICMVKNPAAAPSHFRALTDGGLLAWDDSTSTPLLARPKEALRLWDHRGDFVAFLKGHTSPITGAKPLTDGHVISWSQDRTLRLWDRTGEPLAVFVGHTGPVTGALQLVDKRLLSWSNDRTLRLWARTGRLLAIFKGHTDSVRGALALPDGRLLSWSTDNTLRLWDGATGAHLDCVDRQQAHRSHPDLYLAWSSAESPKKVQHHTVAKGNTRGLTLSHAGQSTTWHADGAWTADHLLPDGTVVARCDKHLAILHLHHGNHRVSVDEAESLTVAAQSAPTLSP